MAAPAGTSHRTCTACCMRCSVRLRSFSVTATSLRRRTSFGRISLRQTSAKTRQKCWQCAIPAHSAWKPAFRTASQKAVCGIRRNNRTVQKPVARFYPDILEPTDKFPSELSCAEASVSAPQAITANIMAATLVLCMLYNILAAGELVTRMTTFSSRTVNVRPLLSGRRAA